MEVFTCDNCKQVEGQFQMLRDRLQQVQLSFSDIVEENLRLRFEINNLKDKLASASIELQLNGVNDDRRHQG
jgi:regulator of replication initiation timing